MNPSVLPVAAAMTFTPVAIALLGKLFPPAELGVHEFAALRARNGWINGIACALCVICFFGPLVPLFTGDKAWVQRFYGVGWPALGLTFGAAVIIPCLWITIATAPFGLGRFHEFWRYYERKYRVGMAGVMAIYIPLGVIGAISAVKFIERS